MVLKQDIKQPRRFRLTGSVRKKAERLYEAYQEKTCTTLCFATFCRIALDIGFRQIEQIVNDTDKGTKHDK